MKNATNDVVFVPTVTRTRRIQRTALLSSSFIACLAAAFAQNNPPAKEPALADVAESVAAVENLARDLEHGVDTYYEQLKKAMGVYGRGFYDSAYKQKLAGFDRDIQTGDPGQTERIKLAVFAAMMRTSRVRLDPDPFHYWERIEKRLASYPATIDTAREL